MKAILLSLGTRGDIEPFLAIAEKLHKKGHNVVCAFPVQFKKLVNESKYEFYGLSEKFLELLEGEKAKIVLGGKGNVFQKIGALIWMLRTSQAMQKEVITQQHDLIEEKQPDIVVYNQKCLYPMIWGIKNPGKTTLLSPLPCTMHETGSHASLGMGSDLGVTLNKFTYRFSNFFLFKTILSSTKRYHKQLGIKVNYSIIKKHILRVEEMIYTISPSLFPKPSDWPENVHIVGYHEKDVNSDWKPSKKLEAFISKHDKILFITFGSMTNPNPEQKTKEILSILTKHKIPAIINTASGGLVKVQECPDHVLFLDTIPYGWILPKMYAAIHHGGSGTLHTALKYGCATMIIPHILDQHIWNDLLTKLKVGPKGVSIKKFSIKSFEKGVLDLLHNEKYKENAIAIGNKMQNENYEDYLLKVILKQ
ncbi:glycosyltransferase [Melioribacter sp. Ez-97]|uniref:glycosyltransferase n=1 Tax=Melioribacter sp. Ez-97 TaxID=3423434 RepID=UPI003EDA9623